MKSYIIEIILCKYINEDIIGDWGLRTEDREWAENNNNQSRRTTHLTQQ